MRNWIKYMALSFLLLFALPVISSTTVLAGLTVENNNVGVSLHIPEGKTETITSLRFQLDVSTESGSMDAPAFQFDSSIKSMVKDAVVTKQEDGSYLIDLVLSGKQDQQIFANREDAKIGTVTVNPTSAEYRIKVEFADTDPKYVDSSGISEETAFLEDEQPAIVEFTKASSPSTNPSTNPENTVQVPTNSGNTVQAPGRSTLKVSRKNYTYVMFAWKKITGSAGYEIQEYDSSAKQYKLIKTVDNSNITAFSKKYSYATAHTFRMRAYKLAEDGSKVYGAYSSTVKITLAPNQVKSFAAKVKGSKVSLSWKKVSRASGYRIYRAAKKNGKYKLLKTIKKGATTKTTVKYTAGKVYYYKIRAYVTGAKKNRVYGTYSKARKA